MIYLYRKIMKNSYLRKYCFPIFKGTNLKLCIHKILFYYFTSQVKHLILLVLVPSYIQVSHSDTEALQRIHIKLESRS